MFSSPGYQLLDHKECDRLDCEGDAELQTPKPTNPSQLLPRILLFALLIVTNTLTWCLTRSNGCVTTTPSADKTLFGLERNVPVAFEKTNVYLSPNRTEALEAWSHINIDAGMVALPKEISEPRGLPAAQEFVWDRSRGTYLLNGHHELHCIRAIYVALMEFYHGVEQTRGFWHVVHCVDSLRQDIICNADDTPRYSTDTDYPESGVNQVRMCRSWDKLEAWSKQYNACYSLVNQTTRIPEVQRFLYCPEGSPYRQQVLETYGNVPTYEELDLEEWSFSESFATLIEAQKRADAKAVDSIDGSHQPGGSHHHD